MIDSHCHLDHEPMFSDLKNVIIRSKENGLEKILSICTTNDSFKKIIEIIKFDPIIYGTFGIHPHETDFDKTTKKEIIKNVNSHEKIIAIGESGLDFYYSHSSKDQQISSFKYHIEAETDSPYLSPVPFRGKKNEPSFIKYTLEKLAEIKDSELKDIEKITNNNFNKLFNLN